MLVAIYQSLNRETLLLEPAKRGFDVRDRLLEFYAKYYSADQMTLCIAGKVSLQDTKHFCTSCGSQHTSYRAMDARARELGWLLSRNQS